MDHTKTRIVIIGAGFGGTYTLKNLHKTFHKNKHVEISLINPTNYFLFTPLLHEVATGSVNDENIIEPLRDTAGCCLAKFYLATTTKIHTKEKYVETSCGKVPYDYLVIAAGAQTNFYNIPGAQEHSFTLKSLEDARALKRQFVRIVETAAHEPNKTKQQAMLTFTVVGGGATGVELAAEMAELFQDTFAWYYPPELTQKIRIILIQQANTLLPQFSKKIQEKSLEVLRKKNIEVRLATTVQSVSKTSVELAGGETIPTKTVIWVAGVKPVHIPFDTDPLTSPDGKLVVNDYLQLENNPHIFALGDVSRYTKDGKPLPALAQVAVKQAKATATNITALMKGKKLKPLTYKRTGDMLSLGQWMAAGEISHFTFWGHFTWWIWRTVYLSKLLSWRKKISVAIDWTIDLFCPRDISEV